MLKKGLTLIEVVVSVGIFATLAIVGSLLLIATLRGAKKAQAVALVRGEAANALGVMTSFFRFADDITACAADGSSVTMVAAGRQTVFACLTSGQDMYLASNSARLTSPAVKLNSCASVFACDAPAPLTRSVIIKFGLARAGTGLPIESTAAVNFESQVVLRNE